MAAGDFSSAERYALDETIRKAEQQSRVEFSLFVGSAEGDPRAFATKLHNSLVAPTRSILIMVDPDARALEIVTGGYVRRTLTDKEVELTALQMQTSFAEGDFVGGLKRGIAMLAEHARPQNTLHAG
ncbi:MAG TPA: TPM domain-containing protein [Pedococcus sp.]|nr:TPM domain-containing protein [Pedococcus sp.]